MTTATKLPSTTVTIKPPNFGNAVFEILGTAPLVIHRFSKKLKDQMRTKMEVGKAAGSKRDRTAKDSDETFNDGRYISKDGWDGFHAGSIRCAMIGACRLVDFKMTLAKLSIFVIADGWDAAEPQIPLIRIHGAEAVRQDDMGRVENGNPYVIIRPAYFGWSAKINLRWDADQFTLPDITNLLSRVGAQCGIGEGRPNSPNSAGMGWGTFELKRTE